MWVCKPSELVLFSLLLPSQSLKKASSLSSLASPKAHSTSGSKVDGKETVVWEMHWIAAWTSQGFSVVFTYTLNFLFILKLCTVSFCVSKCFMSHLECVYMHKCSFCVLVCLTIHTSYLCSCVQCYSARLTNSCHRALIISPILFLTSNSVHNY